jgi:hypothetical protein
MDKNLNSASGRRWSKAFLGLSAFVTLILVSHSFSLLQVSLVTLCLSWLLVAASKALSDKLHLPLRNKASIAFFLAAAICILSILTLVELLYIGDGDHDSLVTFFSYSLLLSLLAAWYVLVFLRSKTGFPRWTRAAGILSVLVIMALMAMLISRMQFAGVGARGRRSGGLPPNAFDVLHRSTISLTDTYTAKVVDHYEIRPVSEYSVVGIDTAWSSHESGFVVISDTIFQVRDKAREVVRDGMVLDTRRPLFLEKSRLGLLRTKLGIEPWTVNMLLRDTSDSSGEIQSGSIAETSHQHVELRIKMPKNSYLGSDPEGRLLELPDRDELVIGMKEYHPQIDLYCLDSMRFAAIAHTLRGKTGLDMGLQAVAFFLWPVTLILLGLSQSWLAGSVAKIFKRQPRRAGFQ